MSTGAKNKILVWLVILLLIANAATIAFFWINKSKQAVASQPPGQGRPEQFLTNELGLDSAQQQKLATLVLEHRSGAQQFRQNIREAKDRFFELIQQNNAADSTKQQAARNVSLQTEALDLLTLDHFQKIRNLCTDEQKKRFDEIIHEVAMSMGQPRPPMGPRGEQGPPPGGPNEGGPPPPVK